VITSSFDAYFHLNIGKGRNTFGKKSKRKNGLWSYLRAQKKLKQKKSQVGLSETSQICKAPSSIFSSEVVSQDLPFSSDPLWLFHLQTPLDNSNAGCNEPKQSESQGRVLRDPEMQRSPRMQGNDSPTVSRVSLPN
jgi:hypothetical protein